MLSRLAAGGGQQDIVKATTDHMIQYSVEVSGDSPILLSNLLRDLVMIVMLPICVPGSPVPSDRLQRSQYE